MTHFTFRTAHESGAARHGWFDTPHGIVETPAFMPVGTNATVRGLTMTEVVRSRKSQLPPSLAVLDEMNDRWARALEAFRTVGGGLVFWVATSGSLAAQAEAGDARSVPVVIPRLEGPIALDGRPTEAAWRALKPFPMIQHLPVFGAAPTEVTEVRIGHSDTHIYVAAVMRMRQQPLPSMLADAPTPP